MVLRSSKFIPLLNLKDVIYSRINLWCSDIMFCLIFGVIDCFLRGIQYCKQNHHQHSNHDTLYSNQVILMGDNSDMNTDTVDV